MRYTAIDTCAMDAALVGAGEDLTVCNASLDAALLIPTLIRATGATACVEIGIGHGYTAMIAMESMHQLFGRGVMIAVDCDDEAVQRFGTLAAKYKDIAAIPLMAHSGDIHLRVTTDYADVTGHVGFAFVDGNHAYAECRCDLMDVLDVLAPGGIILVHDYYQRTGYGVVRAVDEVAEAEHLQKFVLPHPTGSAFVLLRRQTDTTDRSGRKELA